jgi:hypothetical protein
LSNEKPKQEKKSPEEIERELEFYRKQTKVLRDKNRDLRNALLLSESKEKKKKAAAGAKGPTTETFDIQEVIAASKKQISEGLSKLKDSLEKEKATKTTSTPPAIEVTEKEPPTASSKGVVPPTPKISQTLPPTVEEKESEEKTITPPTTVKETSAETDAAVESLKNQVIYLKREVERLEEFLQQSEEVNNRLRTLLTEHSIDVSEIAAAISDASKTAKKVAPMETKETKEVAKEKPEIKTETKIITKTPTEKKEEKKELDPEVKKVFD